MVESDSIVKLCSRLAIGDRRGCIQTISNECPFTPIGKCQRTYSELKKTKIFLRDGFIDRYFGKRLVFPGTLKVLSNEFPNEFPYNVNWKMDSCHVAWWELLPTIDHVVPIARGGEDKDANMVTTCMLKNSIKSNWTLDEMGWSILPRGDVNEWDGQIRWFLDYAEEHPSSLDDPYVSKWHHVVIKCLSQ